MVELGDRLAASTADVESRHPRTVVDLTAPAEPVRVRANERLEQVLTHLLENAVVHTTAVDGETPVEVTVGVTPTTARVSISDTGDGLPPAQQALLEDGEITEYDDPRDGYGLNIVRLLVESFDGRIEVNVTETGTTITVELARAEPNGTGVESNQTGLAGVRPSAPHLAVILGASLLAGVPYGIVSEQLGGSVAAIGVFYGIEDPLVGWLTHEFHSAVFGFVFAGIVSFAPARYRDSLPAYVAIGLGWGFVLWLGAAGVIAPLWLNLLGIPAPLPAFSLEILVSHLVWGVTLGALTVLGYRHLTPWLATTGQRLEHRYLRPRR